MTKQTSLQSSPLFLISKAPIISHYLIMLKYHLPKKPEEPMTACKKQILAMAKPTFCLFLQLDTITFSSVPSEICCFYHLHPVTELKFKSLWTVITSSRFPYLIKAKQTGSLSLAPLGIQRFKISPHCQKNVIHPSNVNGGWKAENIQSKE